MQSGGHLKSNHQASCWTWTTGGNGKPWKWGMKVCIQQQRHTRLHLIVWAVRARTVNPKGREAAAHQVLLNSIKASMGSSEGEFKKLFCLGQRTRCCPSFHLQKGIRLAAESYSTFVIEENVPCHLRDVG